MTVLLPRAASRRSVLRGMIGGGAITVATRLPVGLRRKGGWGDTVVPLPPGLWTDLLTGRRLRASACRGEAYPTIPTAAPSKTSRAG